MTSKTKWNGRLYSCWSSYLSRFKGIEFIDRHYGYAHTQSFASMVDDVAEYCHRRGGALL